MEQPTIAETFEKLKQFGANDRTQIKLNHELMEWLVDAMLPYSTVENDCFKKFVKTLCPRYKIPSEEYLRTCLMPNMYSKVKREVIRIIHEYLLYCSVTTDMWSSAAMDAYMSVTVHFIMQRSWEKKSMVLECLPFNESHSSENLIKGLQSVFLKFGIENCIHAIVRDNAANIVKATNEGGWKNLRCFLHGLHLVITNSLKCQRAVIDLLAKVRMIVCAFRHSTKAKTPLRGAQEKEHLPEHTLILDQETRWSSTYHMLERFLFQKKAIVLASLDMEKLPTRLLENHEWKTRQSLVNLLKGFADVVTYCEKESACISEAIPGVKSLTKMLCSHYYGVNTLKKELLQNLKKYFHGEDGRDYFTSIEENELYTIATLLDPRFKKRGFLHEETADQAEFRLVQLVSRQLQKDNASGGMSNDDREASTSATGPKQRKTSAASQSSSGTCAFAYFDDSSLSEDETAAAKDPDKDANAKKIVSEYLNEPRSGFDDAPLLFWQASYARYPKLANLAIRYLSPPASSVSSERKFKVARDIANGNRVRLRPQNVQKLLFLKYNLKAISYNSVTLPEGEIRGCNRDCQQLQTEVEEWFIDEDL